MRPKKIIKAVLLMLSAAMLLTACDNTVTLNITPEGKNTAALTTPENTENEEINIYNKIKTNLYSEGYTKFIEMQSEEHFDALLDYIKSNPSIYTDPAETEDPQTIVKMEIHLPKSVMETEEYKRLEKEGSASQFYGYITDYNFVMINRMMHILLPIFKDMRVVNKSFLPEEYKMVLSFPLERLDKERILKIAELENVSYVTFLKVYYG